MLKSYIQNSKIYSYIKNKFNFNKSVELEFAEDSKVPGLIEEVIAKRAELNNLILDIGIYCSMMDIPDKAESLYKAFSYDELEGSSEEEWEEQLNAEIYKFSDKKIELETKVRMLEKEARSSGQRSTF